MMTFDTPEEMPLENIVGKGEMLVASISPFFHNVFLPYGKTKLMF